jgi:hypothetical protein
VEHLVQEDGQALVEGVPELTLGEDPGQVLGGEEAVADGTADGRGQAALVLGHSSLEPTEAPPSKELRRLVRMEQHPDGHRVREPPGERAEEDDDQRPQNLILHPSPHGWR